MYVKLNGEMVYLSRAVDHEGEVLESFVTKTRDKGAALTFMKKALKGTVRLTRFWFVRT
jgi:putative transposase